MNADIPIAKMRMLQSSMRCFVFGLLGLPPVVGVLFAMMAMATQGDEPRVFFGFCFVVSLLSMVGFPFAVMTLVISAMVRAKEKIYWNAARSYRVLGVTCAMFGVVSSFVVLALIIFLITNRNPAGG
jgi:magnesium-transporting ATPase (P-type)